MFGANMMFGVLNRETVTQLTSKMNQGRKTMLEIFKYTRVKSKKNKENEKERYTT